MANPIIPNFCEACGGVLQKQISSFGEGPPFICTACGRAVYLDPKVAVAAVIQVPQKGIVLIRRAQRDSAFGRWILPGGHVDRGEDVKNAALREVQEETGLTVSLNGKVGVYSYLNNPTVLIAYSATANGGRLTLSPEALEIKTFALKDIPWDELGYPSTEDALKELLELN